MQEPYITAAWAWIYIVATGLLDVAWTLSLKKANGFANPFWSAVSFVLLSLMVFLLSRAMQILPVGTAYAVWTGIGAVGTVIAGIVLFAEPSSGERLFFIALVITGIVGLKVMST